MKHPLLNADLRSVLGKKVKKLRREGLLPANVYGKDIESKSLQLKLSDFQDIYKQVGETGLIDLKVSGESWPVLIKNLQLDYFNNIPLHADFYRVNLKEKVKTMVPIELAGEAKAVAEKIGVLLQTLNEIEIEALPERIPEKIEVNVEALAEIGAGITVGDLKTLEGVTVLTDNGVTIAKISEVQKEEPAAVGEETAAAGEEAAVEGADTAKDEKGAKTAAKTQEKQEK